MSTATSTAPPNAFATSIGRLFTIRPSTSFRPSQSTGGKTSGIDMLARTARARSPSGEDDRVAGGEVSGDRPEPDGQAVEVARRPRSPAGERCSIRKRLIAVLGQEPAGQAEPSSSRS